MISSLFLLSVSSLASASPTLYPRHNTSTITVDTAEKFQTIEGFGFSTAFQRANLIVNITQPKQDELVDLLYNTTSGAGFSILRNGIGSTNNSNQDFMNTILPENPGGPDVDPEPFYNFDGKDSGQLFVAQKAVEYGVKRFYANAWSAPGFMKTNLDDANGGTLCGVRNSTCASGDWKQAYADYLVRYIQFYAEAGVQYTDLGFLNEPDLTTSYASMRSDAGQAADFIRVLAPTLEAANLSDVVGITCCESTGWRITQQVLAGLQAEGVEDLVRTISSHEYTSRISGPLNTTQNVWQTEYSDLSGNWSTTWFTAPTPTRGDGYTWANTVFDAIVTGNVNAYLFWEGVQDRATNNNNNEKLILVENNDFEVSKRLWAFAQYRGIRPGAVRVGTSTVQGLKTAAFVNEDGSLAVVAINTADAEAPVDIETAGFTTEGAIAWLTDETRAAEAWPFEATHEGISTIVPARGMASFLFPAAEHEEEC